MLIVFVYLVFATWSLWALNLKLKQLRMMKIASHLKAVYLADISTPEPSFGSKSSFLFKKGQTKNDDNTKTSNNTITLNVITEENPSSMTELKYYYKQNKINTDELCDVFFNYNESNYILTQNSKIPHGTNQDFLHNPL